MACSRLSGHIQPSKPVYFTLQRSGIKLVRPLSTVDNTGGYARVSHSRQWSNYNLLLVFASSHVLLQLLASLCMDILRSAVSMKSLLRMFQWILWNAVFGLFLNRLCCLIFIC